MSTATEASVVAQVQGAVAGYARALDADRIDELAQLFWPDGVAEIAGVGVFEGHDAIRRGYAAFAPTRPQLHLVGNVVITSVRGDEVTATSDLVFFQKGDAGWAVQLVGRYDDTLRRRDGEWRFQKRITTFLP